MDMISFAAGLALGRRHSKGKNQDLLFHDILDKGTVIFEHTIANGYSFKIFAYTFVPSDSGFHYDMYGEIFCGAYGYGSVTNYGIRIDEQTGEYVGSNQFISYGNVSDSSAGAALYAVVYKDSVPLYALMNYSVQFPSDEISCIRILEVPDPEDPEKTYTEYKYFKYSDNIKVLSVTGGGSVSGVMTHSQTFTVNGTAYTADFVDGGYNGSFGFGGQYSYQHYDLYDDPQAKQTYQKKDRIMTSGFGGTMSYVYLIPNKYGIFKDYTSIPENAVFATRIHSDLDTDQLGSVFQGVIDALRSEANIDSYPISMLEVID